MRILIGILGFALLFISLWDAFETIILPRRVTRSFRLVRLFYKFTWRLWSIAARISRGVFLSPSIRITSRVTPRQIPQVGTIESKFTLPSALTDFT